MRRNLVTSRTALMAGAAIAAAAALSACGSSGGTAQQTAPSGSAASAATSAPSAPATGAEGTAGSATVTTGAGAGTGSPGPAGGSAGGTGGGTAGAGTPSSAGAAPAGGVATCTAGQLRLSLGPGDVGAGQLYTPLVFTNTGSASCALRGFPGVSVLDAQGRQIGAPATHESGQPVNAVVLRPGKSARAPLHTTNGPLGGSCRPTGSSLRVYPPASHASLQVKARYQVCSGVFTVQPVQP